MIRRRLSIWAPIACASATYGCRATPSKYRFTLRGPVDAARGSRRRRRSAGSAAAGRRGRRGSPWRRDRPGAGPAPRSGSASANSAGSGSVGEGDDVLLVPDLPAADRQEGQVRVFFPEGARRARSVRAASRRKRAQPQRCQGVCDRQVASAAAPPIPASRQTKGMIRMPASAASSTSWSKPRPVRLGEQRALRLDRRSSTAAAARCRSPLPASARSPALLAGALRRDPDEARRQVGRAPPSARSPAHAAGPDQERSCGSSPCWNRSAAQSSGRVGQTRQRSAPAALR